MKLLYTLLLSACFFSFANGQQLLSWTPEFPLDNSTVTITVDCAKGNQGLFNFEGGSSNNVYVHIGVITNLSTSFSDWRYVPFSWGTANAAAKATPLGNNKYSYTITNLRSFFGVPAGETIQKICVIYRNATGSLKQVNSDGSDMYVPVYNSGQLFARLNLPPREPRFVPWLEPITASVGSTITINGVSSIAANLTLKLNGTVVGTAANATTITATPTITTNCDQQITLEAENGGTVVTDIINFYIPPTTTTVPLPTGVQDGINYNSPTSVTLVLYAPGKNTVVAVGDFNSWTAGCAYQFNRTPDGNRFWLTLNGLTAGQIYRFQYLVDGTIRTTDPYTELVLDPWNDQYISSSTYPNMPQYPSGLATGIVGTFQPGATNYNWSSNAYTRPDKKNLVIYELLIRDFLAQNNWQTLTDTLNYLKNLGVSAIEIMPFTEFDGNNSWGYNPAFFFAPDKAYGPKNELKRFIDSAHSKGMAVILDAVFNHVTGQSPLAQLYWNGTSNQPSASNPWLNQTAPHPYSVFNDFNHSAEPTKYHVARFMRHWLTEYKLDGFRWDLSKGFTQTNCGSNVGCWNNYDASRVAIWQRYYDSSQVVSPGSYMILEHLGNDDEEADLAGRGMMLWGKMTNEYNQNTMGFASSSSIDRALYTNRSFWNQPHLVAYAESHDEERLMYKNLNFGNSSNTSYDVKTLSVALKQMEAMQPMLLLIPGPKMIWEFGELGYDKSIFMCENGTIPQPYGTETCKTAPKPPMWNYFQEAGRKKIYDVIAKLNALRKLKPALFTTNTVTTGTNLGNDLRKTLVLSNADIKLVAVSNFDVTQQTFNVTFPQTGLWYEYFTGATLNVTTSPYSLTFAPGEYHVWTTMAPCQTPAPTGTTPVVYCQGATATPLTATGTSLLWYTAATGGTGSATAPTPATTTAGSTSYYVTQTLNGCEGPRLEIVVTINATPTAPTVTTPITYCQNATASQLTATGSSLLWYTVASGGTGSTTAPTPSTTVAGTNTYYVSQTINGCEGPRASIVVNVTALPAAPVASTPISYCQGATATTLTASGTNLLWYTVPTGGTGSVTAPTPSTASVGSVTYYVSQTINSCEGPRASIVVNVNAIPAVPIVTSPITYCQNATASPLTATGTNLLWFSVPTGGTGSASAPVPSTSAIGTFTFYVSQSVNGCESQRASIAVNVISLPGAPTVTSPISYCQGASATALTATGSNLLWYSSSTGGTGIATAPVPSTATAGGTSYWVSQTLTCGESPRAEIVVNIIALPTAPTVTSPISYCQGATATTLTAGGSNLFWYTSASGGTGSATAPTPSTSTVGATTYYVSQTVNGCEGPRASIVVNVNAIPAAPIITSPVTYCQGATAVALTATGTNLLWYTSATGGTGSSTAPTPSTTNVGSTIYYVSQTVNGCEGPRSAITVTITASTPAPTVTGPVNYCQGSAATALTATGTNLLWYTAPSGGTGSSTAPVPSTATVGTTSYWVSQTQSCGESPRAEIVVNILALPAAPAVSSPVTYCQGTTATALTATGSGLLWYTVPTGGTGSSTAPVPSTAATGSVSYYVSQTVNGCEGPRTTILVNVNAIPAAPGVVSPIVYCQNSTATALSASGSNLLWYTVATGGTASTTAPTPSTTNVGTTIYYVSQTVNGCESPRSSITVSITASTPSPTVSSPINYCQGATASALTATGTSLLWYTVASGGTGSPIAPIPSTATVGATSYWVSQTLSCGEGPRAEIVVNVFAVPSAPVVTSPIAYCQGTNASQLTATGTNLLWYTSATGGTGVSTAPTPSTATIGATIYYVSQSTNGCESPRASIVVNVNAIPSAPGVTTPVNYCQNATSVPLTATGTNLLWYTTVTGGIGSATAPTPSTAGAGSTTYYVSQTINGCESPRASIVVVVAAIPSAPVVTTPVVYCQGAVATQLTATGTGLLWYTTPVGGTGSSTAPTPSTTNSGSTIYYVSQTGTCGESPRAAITVTVNATPGAPVVSSAVTYCQGTSATVLTATGSNLLWYTSATGGTGSTTAPTPSTSTAGTTIYYVTQTANGCESPRAAIAVTVNITPNAPGVTSPVTYCQNATATPLTATGTNLLWYNAPSGGTGSVTAPTPQTNVAGSTTYYVSQSTGTCEGLRSAIVVTVNPLPALPAVTSPVSYCENVAAVPLTATGTGLLWFTTASGGTGTATAPTPSTASVGTFTYYVAQTNACGEGPRASIVVNITTGPTAPTGLSVTGITMTSAVLNWTNISGYYYKIEYKASGATTWTTLANGSTSNSYTVTGLTKGQVYDWRVSANCDAAGSNNNFATAQFTTLDRNTEIANVRNGIGIKLSPNPVFNYSSVIDYIVPEAGAVSFTVLNEAGQRVYVFSKTVTAAGQYQIDFKPNIRLAQGFYILQIMQNGKTNYVTFLKR